MHIKWTKALYQTPKHNAFTDLCGFGNRLLCSFREAADHMSHDGIIRIIELSETGQVIYKQQLAMQNCDLRDPKITIAPDGKLILNAYARCYDGDGKWTHSQSICWFSTTAKSWSSAHWYGEKNWWVWRLGWFKNNAYGLAYNRRSNALNWYRGNPLRSFHCEHRGVLSEERHGLGYPNESALCFQDDGTAIAIVRRDADTFSAQLGVALPPYRHWRWTDLHQYIGGPAILMWNPNTLLISGRAWIQRRFKTAIWSLELDTTKLSLMTILPSGGDNSYPGLVKKGNDLFVSYYSSHESEQSNIYLSKLQC